MREADRDRQIERERERKRERGRERKIQGVLVIDVKELLVVTNISNGCRKLETVDEKQ